MTLLLIDWKWNHQAHGEESIESCKTAQKQHKANKGKMT
jgi:hypothetical protein